MNLSLSRLTVLHLNNNKLIQTPDLTSCTALLELEMASNELKGDFELLIECKALKKLNVSKNLINWKVSLLLFALNHCLP